MSDLRHRLVRSAVDDRLHGFDRRVLIVLHEWLDDVVFRRIKVSAVADAVHADSRLTAKRQRAVRATTARAIRRLVGFGYLEHGPLDGALRTFRLATPLRRCNTGASSRVA